MSVLDTFVSPVFAKSLLTAAQEQGCDTVALLDELGIDPAELDDDFNFSAVKYGLLYQRVMNLVQDECFGMMSGGRVQLGSFRLLCLTVIHCDDLRQAIKRSGEFSEVCRGFRIRPKLEILENGIARQTMAGISLLSEEEFDGLIVQENADRIKTSLAVWHRFNSWLIGQEIPLTTISFSFPCPEAFRELAETYPAQFKFDQSFTGLEFDAKYLDARVVQNAQTLDDFLRRAPYHLVISDSARSTLKAKVRTILAKDISGSMPTAETVASIVNMSQTTFRRHLQQEETSFQKIKDECRLEGAIHYLGCADLSNTNVAERLGFDEVSAFFRAFKKWTGMTPGEYRKKLG